MLNFLGEAKRGGRMKVVRTTKSKLIMEWKHQWDDMLRSGTLHTVLQKQPWKGRVEWTQESELNLLRLKKKIWMWWIYLSWSEYQNTSHWIYLSFTESWIDQDLVSATRLNSWNMVFSCINRKKNTVSFYITEFFI